MKTTMTCFTLLVFQCVLSQIDYGIPKQDELPEKLLNIRKAIDVIHFPKENDPIKIKNQYYWKHMTSILCKESQITIIEYGAYLFYNDKWNLRKSYPLKELDKAFGTKKQQMLQAQPYTWANNWRIDNKLFGGWALWYFIGKTKDDEIICGYETIYTTNNILN
jgi:hypothetical protein